MRLAWTPGVLQVEKGDKTLEMNTRSATAQVTVIRLSLGRQKVKPIAYPNQAL